MYTPLELATQLESGSKNMEKLLTQYPDYTAEALSLCSSEQLGLLLAHVDTQKTNDARFLDEINMQRGYAWHEGCWPSGSDVEKEKKLLEKVSQKYYKHSSEAISASMLTLASESTATVIAPDTAASTPADASASASSAAP